MNPRRFVILHVEDDPDDAALVRDAFAGLEAKVDLRPARDGEEAAAALSEPPPPDLVLLDLKLPRRDGIELLGWMRGREALRCVPVVMLTSSDEPGDLRRAYLAGANSYLVKPVDLGSLRELARLVAAYWAGLNRAPA